MGSLHVTYPRSGVNFIGRSAPIALRDNTPQDTEWAAAFYAPRPNVPVLQSYKGYVDAERAWFYFDGADWRDTASDKIWGEAK